MADSTTSKLNLSTESIQVAAEDAREVQTTNQAAAEDGSLTEITIMDPTLYVAAADGDTHVLKARKDDIQVKLTPKKNTVLHVAAQFGQADCVKWILRLGSPSLLQQPNEKGDTPLHLAAREGHLTVVKNLIDAAKKLGEEDTERQAAADCKVMLRTINNEKDTALHEAVRNHHPEVVKLLIQEDPDFAYGANTEGNTPLYIAAEWGFGDLVQMILDNFPSPAHSGSKGRTALHASVILNDQAMTKKILELKPALTKGLDQNGWSPLHFAAYVGCDPTIVTQLLEKSDRYVVYLGVKDDKIGNRTALHIAARRGHVGIVKVLVSHFPDCCEKVDDKGNNVLHLIMPKKIFVTSGLSNNPRLRMRGLMNEKNAEGKTPLHLWHNSPLSEGVNYFPPPETMFTSIKATFVRLRRRRTPSFRVSIRPLGSLEVEEDIDSSKSKGSEEISESKESEEISEGKESKEISNSKEILETAEIKKATKNHMIVAALIATVTFAAVFTLPGGYSQNEGNHQGMAVFSLPTNGTKGKDRDAAIAAKKFFRLFVYADITAFILSLTAIFLFFLAALPLKEKVVLWGFPLKTKILLWQFFKSGYLYTLFAMVAMLLAFSAGLETVIYHSSLRYENAGWAILSVFVGLVFCVPGLLIMTQLKRMRRIG